MYSTQEKSAEKSLEIDVRNHTATALIEHVSNLTAFAQTPPLISAAMGLAIAASKRGYARADLGDIKEPTKTEIGDSVMNNVNEEKKLARRSRNLNLALSVLALFFTLAFGLIGYLSTRQLYAISTNTTQLVSTAARNSEISLALSNLTSSTAFGSYIVNSQRLASLNEPALILPNVQSGYELTSEGKTVLVKTNLWQDTINKVKENPQAPTNEIILSLGVDRIYNEALSRNLTTDTLIGVVATLIEQSR